MHEARLDNALTALDILARADSAAFERGRSDAGEIKSLSGGFVATPFAGGRWMVSGPTMQDGKTSMWGPFTNDQLHQKFPGIFPSIGSSRNDASARNWHVTYVTKDGSAKTITVMALDEDGAERVAQKQHDFDRFRFTHRAPAQRQDAAPSGCTFILVDGAVDQVIQHTGNWKAIVAREVRDLKNMDCGRVTTKDYENESIGYAKHDSVRSDAESYISEAAAMRILRQEGDYSADQARIILNHSLKQKLDGHDYYPMSYIYKRAKG